MSFSKGLKKRNTKDTDEYHNKSLLEMKLHGDYFKRQLAMPNVATDLSKAWLKNSYFRFETESLICAAQEQALATKYTRSKIWKKETIPNVAYVENIMKQYTILFQDVKC